MSVVKPQNLGNGRTFWPTILRFLRTNRKSETCASPCDQCDKTLPYFGIKLVVAAEEKAPSDRVNLMRQILPNAG